VKVVKVLGIFRLVFETMLLSYKMFNIDSAFGSLKNIPSTNVSLDNYPLDNYPIGQMSPWTNVATACGMQDEENQVLGS